MRAMVINGFGGPEVLQPEDIPMPVPKPGEVLIRIAYASVNPADWKCREGWLAQFFDYKFPFVVGFDGAGVIAGIGDGVTEYKIGDGVGSNGNLGRIGDGSAAALVGAGDDAVAHL